MWESFNLIRWPPVSGHELGAHYTHTLTQSIESESYVTTDGHSASLSWNKAHIWGLWPDFYNCQTAVGLLMWGSFSDERPGLSFTIAAGPRQRSHSRVRVPWDSQPYFTVSDSRFPSLFVTPTTRRAMMEVLHSIAVKFIKLQSENIKEIYILMIK
jgi:hypothetical protein